jgi:hypothetical protein
MEKKKNRNHDFFSMGNGAYRS